MSDIELANRQTSVMERGSMSPASVIAHVAKIQGLMKDVLHEGEHYGIIPGTDKPTLLKAGAEKLSFTFRLLPKFRTTVRELGNGHREYEMVCELWHESGVFAGEGVGICSTMESKYRYRNAAKKCPACGKETIIKGKAEYGGGWLCYAKKGGCGAKYAEDDKAITDQVVGKVDNPDIADTYNTVYKMAKKRSLVDATITACAASDIFTQDVEELAEMVDVTPARAEKKDSVPSEYREAYAAGKAAQDSGLFTDDEIKGMLAQLAKHKDDKPSLLHLAKSWRDEALFRAQTGGKVPFGEEKVANE